MLVVCDGVSTSLDSDVASLTAARTARDTLAAHKPAGLGTPTSRVAAISNAVVKAAAAANAAVIDARPRQRQRRFLHLAAAVSRATSWCTATSETVGSIGFLMVVERRSHRAGGDDSVAQMRIAMGTPRDEAENGPQAHAITNGWGATASTSRRVRLSHRSRTGWLLVCSDGLWNYASEASAIQSLIADLTSEDPSPAYPGDCSR